MDLKRKIASCAHDASLYAMTHGILSFDLPSENVFRGSLTGLHVPITLQPMSLPRIPLQGAVRVTEKYNIVLDRIARDLPFLLNTLYHVSTVDPFVERLLSITISVYAPTDTQFDKFGSNSASNTPHATVVPYQKWMLCVNRYDYMLERTTNKLRQVEFNTIASAFICLAGKVNALHRFTHSKYKNNAEGNVLNPAVAMCDAQSKVCQALVEATHLWRRENATRVNSKLSVLLVIRKADERNLADIFPLSEVLSQQYGLQTVYATLSEVATSFVLRHNRDIATGKERVNSLCAMPELCTPDGLPVSVAYYRCGYDKNDYPTEDCWHAREIVERASCIKCPSLPHHLCTLKKVQEALCSRELLLRYGDWSKDEIEELTSYMLPQYDLLQVGEKEIEGVEDALHFPTTYVLKSYREGSGQIFTGDAMTKLLQGWKQAMRGGKGLPYLLTRKIDSVTKVGHILHPKNGVQSGLLVPEIGIYGIYLSHETGNVLTNESSGYLIRTKFAQTSGGGVTSGMAALDSPLFEC